MNWGKVKGPPCYLCLPGAVLTSLTQWVAGSNTIFYKKYHTNSRDYEDSEEFNEEKLDHPSLVVVNFD